jgi:hypothetical protein
LAPDAHPAVIPVLANALLDAEESEVRLLAADRLA